MSKINEWRIQEGYTLEFVKGEIGCSRTALYNWMNGENICSSYRNRFIRRFGKDPVKDFGLKENIRVLKTAKV